MYAASDIQKGTHIARNMIVRTRPLLLYLVFSATYSQNISGGIVIMTVNIEEKSEINNI